MKLFVVLTLWMMPILLSAQEQEMVKRFYPVDPTRWIQIKPSISRTINPTNNSKDPFGGEDPFGGAQMQVQDVDLKYLFEKYGVSFPEGASIVYEPLLSRLIVVNTPENIAGLEEILRKTDTDVRQVSIDYWAVRFDEKDLDSQERKLGRPLREEELIALWREGEGERIFSQSLRTVHGVNALLELSPDDSEMTSEMSLNVTPTVGSDSRINLVMLTSHRVPGKEGATGMLWDMTTSMVLLGEKPAVAGSLSSKDGKQRIIFFISARVLRIGWPVE